jgi:serpin B
MTTRLVATLLTVALLCPFAGARDAQTGEAIDGRLEMLAQGEVQFSRQLYAQLRSDEGNIVFSPHSVQSALMMTMVGAKGLTWGEMYCSLALPASRMIPPEGLPYAPYWPDSAAHEVVGRLAAKLAEAGQQQGIDLAIANSIWPAQRFRMHSEFVNTLKQSYGVTVTPTTYPGPGREKINAWVEGKTHNRIKNLLAPGSVDGDTVLVLVNVIYFKGNWHSPFDPNNTWDRPFHLTAEKQIEVQTMYQFARFKYFDDDAKQVLEMPYKGDDLSMVIVLPKRVDGLAAVEKQLDLQAIGEKLSTTRRQKVMVSLPKFKYEFEKTFNEPLQALGMKLAFKPQADFTGMSSADEPLFISLVQHKAFIEVNETGSEAAAATAVEIAKSIAVHRVQPPAFRADRPFVFYIRHIETGAILFMGRMSDPRS